MGQPALACAGCGDPGSEPCHSRHRQARPRNSAMIEICDNGRPIPPDQLPTIFEPSFVGPKSGRGSGIEFSICREIVRQHGGQITAESDRPERLLSGSPCRGRSNYGASQYSRHRRRLHRRQDNRRSLRGDEFRVTLASRGEKGIFIARQNPTDLVILDIIMPDMDGYQVCRTMRADPQLMEIPILFLTAKCVPRIKSPGSTLARTIIYVNHSMWMSSFCGSAEFCDELVCRRRIWARICVSRFGSCFAFLHHAAKLRARHAFF